MWQRNLPLRNLSRAKTKRSRIGVPRLLRKSGPVDRPPIEPRRRPRLQAASSQAQPLQRLAQQHRCRLAASSRRIMLLPTVNQPIQKCSSSDDGCACVDHPPIPQTDADDPRMHGIVLRALDDIHDFRLLDEQIRLRLQHLAHLHAILLLVALRPRRPNRRSPGSIQQAKLDPDRIGDFAHDAAQRVYFAHKVPLGDAANRRITAHLRNQVEVQREQGGAQSHARRGHRRLASGMSGAHHHHVVLFAKSQSWGLRAILPALPENALSAKRQGPRFRGPSGKSPTLLENEMQVHRDHARSANRACD